MKTSDENLLSRYVIEGDKEAFDRLHRRYRDRVLNFVWRYCGDFQKAEEVTQDTFLKVYRKAHRFHFRGKVSSWIYRIAVNEARAVFRRAHRKHAIQLQSISFGDGEEDPRAILVDSTTPVVILENREFELKVRRCLNALRLKHREVLLLRAVEGLSYREIAEVLGCRVGTVSSMLNRARTEFRNKFEAKRAGGTCNKSVLFVILII